MNDLHTPKRPTQRQAQALYHHSISDLADVWQEAYESCKRLAPGINPEDLADANDKVLTKMKEYYGPLHPSVAYALEDYIDYHLEKMDREE